MREKKFGFIFWWYSIISCCLFWSRGEDDIKTRQTFVIRYKDEDQTIPVTVVLDYKKQTEYVINMNPRTPAKSVTFYDFKQRTIAYKDLTNKECFLGRLTHETISEESNALQDVKNPVEVKPKIRSLDPKTPALTPTEIRNIAGQKTAAFCRKMNTWLLMPEKSPHSISKREADEEFEEHTLQYHGHRSTQYSHYEKQTRRRFRNRGQANHRRRSRTKESAAEEENGGLAVLEQNIPAHSYSAAEPKRQIHSHDYGIPENQFPFTRRNFEDENKNLNEDSLDRFNKPVTNQNDFKYLNPENRHFSQDAQIYPRQDYFNSGDTNKISYPDQVIKTDSSRDISGTFVKNGHLARLTADESESGSEIKSVTTQNPEFLYQPRTDHPNVHPSLLHLLPLYKPLGREFDFLNETKTDDQSNNQVPAAKHRESEAHSSSTHLVPSTNTFFHFTDVNNTSYDPDVSVNVLEIPKITKEYENIQNNRSHITTFQDKNNRRFPNSSSIHPSVERSRSIGSRNNALFNRNLSHVPKSETIITTAFPVLTTSGYFTPERTTSEAPYIPSVHTAFRNLEDFNSFQIFPNYIDNTIDATEKNPIAYVDKSTKENIGNGPQDLIITTSHPLIEENSKSNHRSDLPSEGSDENILTENFAQSNAPTKDFKSNDYNRTGEDIFTPKIRYQNAIRDFKPDEIVIDIENIPTHTPAPVTAKFHQRILTTIQPTIRALPTENARSDTARRGEQTSVTSWRSLIPTTRFPRRRINSKTRIPAQRNSVSFVHRNSVNQNQAQLPSPHLNQLTGLRNFNPIHQTNRHQFYYPSHPNTPFHPIPPSSVHLPPKVNQIHPVSQLNNLPPGVSVHPRHPQAPFADMILSNRPPTIPVLNDGQEYLKPHRQRHHRKKDRIQHSCCRLRGNSGAFQSCCRNGGPCCSRSHRFAQPTDCCSSSKLSRQIIPATHIQPQFRTANKILPSIRTEKTHRSEVDNKDRCQKEKMCRTLYESTQQVMVCRNGHVEGC